MKYKQKVTLRYCDIDYVFFKLEVRAIDSHLACTLQLHCSWVTVEQCQLEYWVTVVQTYSGEPCLGHVATSLKIGL